jgi:large subunit ribosomal protein L30
MSKQNNKVKVTQLRSIAGRDPATRSTIQALGLGKIGKSKVHSINAQITGMLRKVEHLVGVVEVKE